MKDKLIGWVILALMVVMLAASLWACASFKYGGAFLTASLVTTILVCVVAGMAKREVKP